MQKSNASSSGDTDEQSKSLDLSVAFPQATGVSVFPPSVSEYFQFDELLTSEDKTIKYKVREFMEKEVAPIMTKYWEKAEFPHEIIPKLAALGISGGTIKGYGCPGFSMTTNAMIAVEVARVDASICTFLGVHSYCAMRAIDIYGSEEQKRKYLPSLAEFKTIACWGATEPGHGSEMNILSTTATKVAGGWVINGQKRWIGNSTFADIFVICARVVETNKLKGFIVKKGAPGLQASKIENKVGLRIVQNGDILLNDVFVSDEDALPGDTKGFTKIGEVMRLLTGLQALGISMGAYDMCHRYLKQRQQFGAPLAAFQLNQQKLVRMLSNIQAMFMIGWRACKLFDNNKLTSGHASMTKSWITMKARENVALARELLGGNGILLDFHVAKAFCDLEAPYTYEGTYDMHTLIVGMEVLGIPSFGPPCLKKRSSL